jgi:hypothetical protein
VSNNFHSTGERGFLSATIDAIIEAMRNSWTDEPLDDLSAGIDARFDRLEGRFDKLQHTLVQISGGMVVAVLGTFAALVGLIATQL